MRRTPHEVWNLADDILILTMRGLTPPEIARLLRHHRTYINKLLRRAKARAQHEHIAPIHRDL